MTKMAKKCVDYGTNSAPIDRGWAWMVVLGAFVNLFVTMSIIKSFGIIFVELLQYYQRSATETAAFFPIWSAFGFMTGIKVMHYCIFGHVEFRFNRCRPIGSFSG